MSEQHPLVTAIQTGEPASYEAFATLGDAERADVVRDLLDSHEGRRWLRGNPHLESALADELLTYDSDFRQSRRDRTLGAVVERASLSALSQHVDAIATGSAASALWNRLSADPGERLRFATMLVATASAALAEATLHLLVLDPLNSFDISDDDRSTIARQALMSSHADVRGIAAEYLAEAQPRILLDELDRLTMDDSQRVRGVTWNAALRVDRSASTDRAMTVLGDESIGVALRRSALIALGSALPTAQMVEILAFFVVHPNHELAADAAELLYQQHRNPVAATAAQQSPHEDVREIAERLLDPQRGSPAAGGSRPGDPTRSSADIFADMIQQLERKQHDQNDDPER